MATLTVSYPLSAGATFDRDYYLSTHVPLVQAAWAEFGLQSAEVLFPAAGPQPLAGLVLLRFADQAGVDAALASPRTREVIGDVLNFTNISPVIFRADD
ncbi:ethyl tert-butyl ether degradation protein EthD [Metapseudomonas resinovorans]|uniref:EthD family reductase n=1 Tax=Metapseudomonas resinovorans TaxID=53412 RepID=UPI000984FC67|nr:EthD family reductase [Pseudomonas resinovorans]GLZ87027.1 ethyl tert-butyl ether degradation protein EthD [Pseudomonas resinovorans]